MKEVLKLNKLCQIDFNIPALQAISKEGLDLLKRMLEK